MYDRYLWPIWGILFVLFAVPANAGTVRTGPGGDPVPPGFGLGVRQRVLLAVFGLSLATNALAELYRVVKPGGVADQSAEFVSAAERLGPGRTYAGITWRPGLYTAYWSNGRFVGQVRNRDAKGIAAELAPFAPVTLLVATESPLVNSLIESGLFRRGEKSLPTLEVLELVSSPENSPDKPDATGK
jgi:hypothetical protein